MHLRVFNNVGKVLSFCLLSLKKKKLGYFFQVSRNEFTLWSSVPWQLRDTHWILRALPLVVLTAHVRLSVGKKAGLLVLFL